MGDHEITELSTLLSMMFRCINFKNHYKKLNFGGKNVKNVQIPQIVNISLGCVYEQSGTE